jgi:hypothetical protein
MEKRRPPPTANLNFHFIDFGGRAGEDRAVRSRIWDRDCGEQPSHAESEGVRAGQFEGGMLPA